VYLFRAIQGLVRTKFLVIRTVFIVRSHGHPRRKKLLWLL